MEIVEDVDGVPHNPAAIGTSDLDVGPDDLEEWKALRFDNEIDCYSFYSKYAERSGFIVRVRCRNVREGKNRTPDIRHYLKDVCNKEGYNTSSVVAPSYVSRNAEDPIAASFEGSHVRPQFRCGCTASIVICYDEDEKKYVITEWVGEHFGHESIPKELAYMQTSNMSVRLEEGLLAEMNDRVGVSLDTSYRLMCRGVGGAQNLGCLKVDLKNYLQTKRKTWMEPSEGVSIQQHLKRTTLKNPDFFFEIQYDCDDLITNIFWADQCMIMNYALFGDAITFDTTYRTNKAYRPLGLFAGFNHHRQIIVFGAALLFDETIPSFEWLFKTFYSCMGSVAPTSFFTDQDKAMAVTLKSTLPTVPCFLCTWHILQNAKNNLHSLLLRPVNKTLSHLMYHVENVVEFDYVWSDMMTQHFSSTTPSTGFSKSHTWLIHLRTKREQWSNCWVNKKFTTGMRTTQANESVNGTARGFLKSDHRLMDFFPHFEEMLETIRRRENIKEFEARDKVAINRFIGCPNAARAFERYTPTIMRLFHYKHERALEYLIGPGPAGQSDVEESWTMYKFDALEAVIDSRVVHFGVSLTTLRCSCCLYDTIGILCRHIIQFMVIKGSMGMLELRTLPSTYLLRRWCRYVRSSYSPNDPSDGNDITIPVSYVGRYQRITASAVILASLASYDDVLYADVTKEIQRLISMSKKRLSEGPFTNSIPKEGEGEVHANIPTSSQVRPCSGLKPKRTLFNPTKRPRSVQETIHQQLRAKHQRGRRKALLDEERQRKANNTRQTSTLDLIAAIDASRAVHSVISVNRKPYFKKNIGFRLFRL